MALCGFKMRAPAQFLLQSTDLPQLRALAKDRLFTAGCHLTGMTGRSRSSESSLLCHRQSNSAPAHNLRCFLRATFVLHGAVIGVGRRGMGEGWLFAETRLLLLDCIGLKRNSNSE